METRSSYLLVGSFVLILLAGAAAFVVWLAQVRFDTELARYDIKFSDSVAGLSVGSNVAYRGIPVGDVIEIGLDPDDGQLVLVTVEIDANTPVLEDTLASVERQGVAGVVNVMLSGGTRDATPLQTAPGQRYPVIASRRSSLQQLFEEAPGLVESVSDLAIRASRLLNARNQASFAETLENLAVFTGALADGSNDVGLLINDAAGTMANLRDTSAALEELVDQLSIGAAQLIARADATLVTAGNAAGRADQILSDNQEDITGLISDFRQATDAFTNAANEVQSMVAENRAPLNEFSNGTLPELSNFLTDASVLVAGLTRITTEIERDPARFLFGDRQLGYETGD